MSLELRWLANVAPSSLHAAEAVLRGAPLTDAGTASAIAEQAAAMGTLIESSGWDTAEFFRHAVPLSATFDQPVQWAKAVCAKLSGPGRTDDIARRLARQLDALQSAFCRQNPHAAEELALRVEPLRSQWEARGPGLIAALSRRTEPDLIVATAGIILVHPVLGGAGAAHVLYNAARIEAVLVNPVADLPEVARLAWLIAQLQLDVPRFDGGLHPRRLIELWPLAMTPAVLAAAQDVELTRFDRETLATAVSTWSSVEARPMVDTLSTWWETYESSRPPWGVAIAALDRMLLDA